MKKNYTVIPPKQKYMTLAQIRETYGNRGVVAYSCKVANSVPLGGYVIAVQDKPGKENEDLRAYQRAIKKQHPDKNPIYYFCLEDVQGNPIKDVIIPDEPASVGEAAAPLPNIEIKKSALEEAVANIPEEILAKALSTSMKKDDI